MICWQRLVSLCLCHLAKHLKRLFICIVSAVHITTSPLFLSPNSNWFIFYSWIRINVWIIFCFALLYVWMHFSSLSFSFSLSLPLPYNYYFLNQNNPLFLLRVLRTHKYISFLSNGSLYLSLPFSECFFKNHVSIETHIYIMSLLAANHSDDIFRPLRAVQLFQCIVVWRIEKHCNAWQP